MLIHSALSLCLVVLIMQLTGCAFSRTKQLERVAKDWCLTIRASQVLPVYPLTEDIQPGDVFLVQTPLSQQTTIYRKRGFLPLDQLVTRLDNLNFPVFYKDAYWKGTYAKITHQRPGWPETSEQSSTRVAAPRAAFPTYNFSVQRGGGLRLAIPIQGVPVALGLMGASRATGTVTINDAYTYGVDGESLVRRFYQWWQQPDIVAQFKDIARQSDQSVYLRIVTRVYLTGGVIVGLTNLDTLGAGVDAGAAQAIQLPDLSTTDPTKLEASAKAYQAALQALSGQGNVLQNVAPGGSLRFLQASQRSVTLSQDFDRPLVIGYVGFDVRIFRDGRLSAPIPSFAVVSGDIQASQFKALEWSHNTLSDQYVAWLRIPENRDKIVQWLKEQQLDLDPADLAYNDEFLSLVESAAKRFGFGVSKPREER